MNRGESNPIILEPKIERPATPLDRQFFPDWIYCEGKDMVVRDYFPENSLLAGNPLESNRSLMSQIRADIRARFQKEFENLSNLEERETKFSFSLDVENRKLEYIARVIKSSAGRLCINLRNLNTQSRREDALYDRDFLFRAILQSSALILFVCDRDCEIQYIEGMGSVPFHHNENIEVQSFRGRSLTALIPATEEMQESVHRALHGEESAFVFSTEPKGTYQVRFIPLKVDVKNQAGFAGLITDVTHQTKLEERLRFSQKMEIAGRLAGGLSHDFNNLLTTIMMNIDQLLKKWKKDSPEYKFLEVIDRNTERAASLTGRLLAFSRKQISNPVLLEPETVTEDLSGMLERILGENIEFRFRKNDLKAVIYIDSSQFEQIMFNLALRAREVMHGGGIFEISIGRELLSESVFGNHDEIPAGDYVTILVRYHGEKLDQDSLSHLFEPFYSSIKSGLNLSAVHGIVTQNGGFVGAKSNDEIGTDIYIYLPHMTQKRTDKKVMNLNETTVKKKNLILVEDNPDVRESLILILKQAGCEVLSVTRSEELLEMITNGKADIKNCRLLISDVVLPGISGPQLYQKISKDYPDLQVLFISGYPDSEMENLGVVSEKVQMLQKPFRPAHLIARINEMLKEA